MGDFVFNDEFFLDKSGKIDAENTRLAEKRYRDIWFALFSEFISKEFSRIDATTRKQKAVFQRAGIWSVGLSWLSLSLLAGDTEIFNPLLRSLVGDDSLARFPAGASLFFGLTAALIGWAGLGMARSKRIWLQNRFLCERIRQWRWQYYIETLDDAARAMSDVKLQKRYTVQRDQAFQAFLGDLRNNLDYHFRAKTLQNSDGILPDLSTLPDDVDTVDHTVTNEADANASKAAASGRLDKLFEGYADLRFNLQERYAVYLTSPAGPFRTHPVCQRFLLRKLGYVSVFSMLILLGVSTAITLMDLVPEASGWLGALTLIIALTALAARVVEDGLNPAEHIGRLSLYLREIKTHARRFERARSKDRRLTIAREMEQIAYSEMVMFLKTGDNARFLM